MQYNLFTKRAQLGPNSLEYGLLFRELLVGTDRGTAVIGGSLVDSALEAAIKVRLIVPRGKTSNAVLLRESLKQLFGIDRPLGAFSARRRLAHVMGIIGPKSFKDLETIGKIRNAFSHWHLSKTMRGSAQKVSFRTQQIHDWCKNLFFADRLVLELKEGVRHFSFPKGSKASYAAATLALMDELLQDIESFRNGEERDKHLLP